MKTNRLIWIAGSMILVCLGFLGRALADDTCVFAVTPTDVRPKIYLLIDNSVAMEYAIWHDDYDNAVDYTPGGGSVFTNARGYGVFQQNANTYYLSPIEANLTLGTAGRFANDGMDGGVPYWIINGRNIKLPAVIDNTQDADGIRDAGQAGHGFRYSTNYLNWIYYDAYAGDGTDLPAKSRFYYAKKALLDFALAAEDKVEIGIFNFSGNTIASTNPSQLHPLHVVYDPATATLDNAYINGVGGMGTVYVSPLAAGLAAVGGRFKQLNHSSSFVDCQKSFVIVVSPGVSSQESMPSSQVFPTAYGDYDGDGGAGIVAEGQVLEDNTNNNQDDDGDTVVDEADEAVIYNIPVNINGNTYLDDIAHYLYVTSFGTATESFRNLMTYTIGFMGDHDSNLFLINTANNGNGELNLYDTANPEYGKYHMVAETPDGLESVLMEALNSILERTNAFAAPVVPVTRTTSGDRLYMSFFTPRNSNFWEGNVVKFGLNSANEIVDANGDPATDANGAIKDTAVPYWQTMDWAIDSTVTADPPDNGILYTQRNIITYLGTDTDLTAAVNDFDTTNANITYALLGSPVDQAGNPRTVADVVNYVRGGDPFDADEDTILGENRQIITGDVLHSEPMVYEFLHTTGTLTLDAVVGTFQDNEILRGDLGGYATVNGTISGADLSYDALQTGFVVGETVRGQDSNATATISVMSDKTMIFFGSNDGMLHAVKDEDGSEAWGFIPPHQLDRLKDIIDGASHQYFVDGSAKVYLKDLDGDGYITDMDGDGLWEATDDQVILISGERSGSTGYFALDITVPLEPKMLWRINAVADGPDAGSVNVVAELGESWSEPQFGKVQTTAVPAGVDVMLIGGGFDDTDTSGLAVLAINVLDGTVVKTFKNGVNGIAGMDYSIASTVTQIDGDNDGFIDKVYVGDMGGQLWRIGKFTEADGVTLRTFPDADENIDNWTAHILFDAGCNEQAIKTAPSLCGNGADDNANGLTDELRKFYYRPTVTLHTAYDLVYVGSGDRDNPCYDDTYDGVFVLKDDHSGTSLDELDLLNATTDVVDLAGGGNGWFYPLDLGEKVLAETTVFQGVFYFTTFTPNDDPCLPGGLAKLYALDYNSGAAVINYDETTAALEPSIEIGGGIPSKPVIVISDTGREMFVSVGTTKADDSSTSTGAGIVAPGMSDTDKDMYYLWWRDMF